MPTARPAHGRDVPVLATVLARAFARDPVSVAIFSDPRTRPARLRRFFAFQLLHQYLPRGEVLTTDERCAAALWLPPSPVPARPLDRLAHLELVALLGSRYLWTRRLGLFLGAHHPRRPHYYLGILGTDPPRQAQGFASALLAPVLARCDREGVPAYLESSRAENVGFYARSGFVVREEVVVPDGPRLWLMERSPRI